MQVKVYVVVLLLVVTLLGSCTHTDVVKTRAWSERQAERWHQKSGWLRGCNFIPSTAVNQLEMWQEDTFDPETIQRELTWAHETGFNCMRVYLHHVAWQTDPTGFKSRMNQYLTIAGGLDIKTIFVFFDDCWNPTYSAGLQPQPKPGVHNSGWLRDPGDAVFQDSSLLIVLEDYIKDVLTTFGNDKRIVLWDLYNEPGNSGYGEKSLMLLEKVFHWGREMFPDQPFTAGAWTQRYPGINRFLVENSDIISYHNYENPDDHKKTLDTLLLLGKPVVCTGYMARNNNSLFQNIMPLLKDQEVGAISWGLVAGKTNTIYSWWEQIPDGSEPEIWFHDIFRADGTPYRSEEIECIRNLTRNE